MGQRELLDSVAKKLDLCFHLICNYTIIRGSTLQSLVLGWASCVLQEGTRILDRAAYNKQVSMNIIGSFSPVKLSARHWLDRNPGQRSTNHNDSRSNQLQVLGSSVFIGSQVKATISSHAALKPRHRTKVLQVHHLLFLHCLGSFEFFHWE